MERVKADFTLDATGLSCPMPVVKTRKAIEPLQPGQILEVLATDKGSKADLKAWADSVGHQYLGLLEQDGLFTHYIRKSGKDEQIEKTHPHTISNEQLKEKLDKRDTLTLLDVREEAEFAFKSIPGALSIPLGELENRLDELDQQKEIYVICRTGNRSDLAARMLTEKGFTKVFNVIPGMEKWDGKTVNLLESTKKV